MSKTYRVKKTVLWQTISLVLLIALVVSMYTGGFGITGRSSDDTCAADAADTGDADIVIDGDTDGAADAGTDDAGSTDDDSNRAELLAAALEVAADDPVKGDPGASVTIITYSDFSCPFCAAAAGGNEEVIAYLKSRDPNWEPTVPGIIENYVNTGKARIIFRYFPGHGTGEEAMKIALCANEQGKFWEAHDKFFEKWGEIEGGNIDAKDVAQEAGADISKIDDCLATKRPDTKIMRDIATGSQAQITGTPAFFVNDQLVSGAASFKTIKNVIEAELAK